jgi:hypothetical protein
MSDFLNLLLIQVGTMLASFARSFVCAGIGILLAADTGVLDMGANDWRIVANASIAAGLLTLYKALDPAQTSYGIGSLDA